MTLGISGLLFILTIVVIVAVVGRGIPVAYKALSQWSDRRALNRERMEQERLRTQILREQQINAQLSNEWQSSAKYRNKERQ
jgi:hypothetical protein